MHPEDVVSPGFEQQPHLAARKPPSLPAPLICQNPPVCTEPHHCGPVLPAGCGPFTSPGPPPCVCLHL